MKTSTEPIRERLIKAVQSSLQALKLEPVPAQIHLERPKKGYGDWATNVAFALAKTTGRKAPEVASEIANHLNANLPEHVAAVEVAGGFVNFRLNDSWLREVLATVIAQGPSGYGSFTTGGGKRVLVEFLSANPTGPLHVGNGWWGSYGDAVARLLAQTGFDVTREYYVNDTGGQIRRLGESLIARKRGEAVPEDGYQGEYVSELARSYEGEEEPMAAGKWAAEKILANIKDSLEKLGIVFDSWFSQASIEESGAVEELIELFRQKGLIYEQDGKTWLKSTAVGDSRDRVLVKENGDFTYLAGDLAYHYNKLVVRDFDLAIDVFGADHHGQVASLTAGMKALGIDASRLEVRLGQMISLAEGKMSKRAGNFVALSTLVDDIGAGATRFLSLTSSINQATTLDLALVRSESMENPVHYVRYAHARIASIERVRADRGITRLPFDEVNLDALTHQAELDLMRSLSELKEVIELAARERAPHLVSVWLRATAGRFHTFYHDCPILSQDVAPETAQARLWLTEAVRICLVIGLSLLGIDAPERM